MSINFLYQSELIALTSVPNMDPVRYKRAASQMSFIAYAVADDPKCLPVKVDHKAILLMSCNAPETNGLRFFKLWVGLFLNLGL